MRQRFAPLLLALLGLALGAAPAASAADPPTPLVLSNGHIDVGPRFVGDELRIQFKLDNGLSERWVDVDDALFYVGKTGRIQVPVEGSNNRIWDFIAPQGTSVWWMPDTAKPGLPWAGFNFGPSDRFDREFSLILEGVSGPGHAIMQATGLPFFSTRSGLPAIFPLVGHFHMSWYFTEPGVYCLALAAAGREKITGEQLDARGQLTVVTEPVDPATVQPCGRVSPPPQASAPPVPEGARGGPSVVSRALFELRPTIEGDSFSVPLVQRSGRDPGIARRPEDVVFYLRAPASQAPAAPWQSGGSEVWQVDSNPPNPGIVFSTLGIDPEEIEGDVELRLAEVEGPGSFSLDNRVSRNLETRPMLSDAPGYETSEYPLWPRAAESDAKWSFSAPGVYCVGLELTATPSGGEEVTKRLDLTFAVDEPELRYSGGAYHPVAATLDPAEVAPCARKGEPEGPTVLSRGHLDLSTRLLDGALDVSVRDDSAVPAVHRAPAGVLIDVGPQAMLPVPADPAYSFLGSPGEPLWMLPQIQDPDLPWPGWSTEALSAAQIEGPVTWRLRRVRGPGEFALWTNGGLGAPAVIFNSRDGLPDATAIPLGTHAHANWGFSQAGLYCLDLQMSATTSFGRAVSREQTLAFAVGLDDLTGLSAADCPPPVQAPTGQPPGAGPSNAGPPSPGTSTAPPARLSVRLRLDRMGVPTGTRARGTLIVARAGKPVRGVAKIRVGARPRLTLRFDGEQRQRRFRLPALARGRHSLTAVFSDGSVQIASKPVALSVRSIPQKKTSKQKDPR